MTKSPEIASAAHAKLVQYSGYAALILAVSAAAASVFLDVTTFAFAANGVLLAYLVAAFVLGRGNAQVASRLGENVYFLGYLLTITGLVLLAWEIGNHPDLLNPDKIKQVLLRGGNAVCSTLIGLIGMNLIKGYAQSLEQETQQEADVVERILTKFAKRLEQSQVSLGQELIRVFEASQLSQNMRSLASQLGASAKSVEIETAGLNREITAVTTGMKAFYDSLEVGNKQTQSFVDASKQHHDEILKTMQTFHQRMQTLTPLASTVDEFVKAANTIVPTLRILGENFREVGNLNQNLKQLVASTLEFSNALTAGETGLLNVEQKSGEMGLAVDDLITKLKSQVQTLTTLSKPFEEFSKLSERLSPVLERTDANIQYLTQFTESAAGLQKSVHELEASFKANKIEMDGVSKVVENFVRVMENRLGSK